MYFTSTDGSEDTFVYQPTVDTLELKKDKGTDYVLSWKSNGVYNSKHKSLYTASYIGIKFDKHPLAVEQNNSFTKIANVYIVYDLATWPKIALKNFTLKNGLFGTTNIVKHSD